MTQYDRPHDAFFSVHIPGTAAARFNFPASLKRYTLAELAHATDNWSEAKAIGRGGFAQVYEGEIAGKKYAVKRLHIVIDRHVQREVRKVM